MGKFKNVSWSTIFVVDASTSEKDLKKQYKKLLREYNKRSFPEEHAEISIAYEYALKFVTGGGYTSSTPIYDSQRYEPQPTNNTENEQSYFQDTTYEENLVDKKLEEIKRLHREGSLPFDSMEECVEYIEAKALDEYEYKVDIQKVKQIKQQFKDGILSFDEHKDLIKYVERNAMTRVPKSDTSIENGQDSNDFEESNSNYSSAKYVQNSDIPWKYIIRISLVIIYILIRFIW